MPKKYPCRFAVPILEACFIVRESEKRCESLMVRRANWPDEPHVFFPIDHMAGSATVSAYELPPFELVKLLQPAFQSLPRLDAGFTTSPPGSSSGAAASSVSPPTLSNRLSQLVNKNAAIAQQQRLAAPAEVSTSPTPGPSGIQASLNAKAQIARTAEAGGDTVWIAGSEGSVAVWKLDPSRSKGKERAAQQDNEVAATAEEVRVSACLLNSTD